MISLKEMLGPWADPPAWLSFGRSGTGKTVDFLKTDPTAVVLQLPGATRPWNRVLGMPSEALRTREVKDLLSARRTLRSIVVYNRAVEKGEKKGRVVRTIIADDVSLLAEAEFRRLREEIGRGDNFWFHEQLKASLGGFAHEARMAGVFLFANAHLVPPGVGADGATFKGGPKMPVKALINDIPHIFDNSIRVDVEDERKPWPAVYVLDGPDGSYVGKDRHNVVREVSPMNLRELLIQVGYVLPRAPGMEWMDALAEDVAGKLGGTGEGAHAKFTELWVSRLSSLKEKQAPREKILHNRWALQDGRDRYEIRAAEEAALYAL